MKFTSCQNVDCNKEYDFNDLIDVTVQAYKDGVLNFFEVGNGGTSKYIIATHNENDLLFHHGDSSYNHAVEYINSLYTETFVIESEDHIEMVKLKASVKLTNGNEFIVDNATSEFLTSSTSFEKLTILTLKGATVTQKRSL